MNLRGISCRLGRFGLRGAAALTAALACLAVAAVPAQAGKGWKFKEAFGSAGKPKFREDRSFAVDSAGRLLMLDTGQVNEQQRVTIDATAGQFKLEFNGETTADINFNATSVQLREALRALLAIGGGLNVNVTVSGGPGDAGGTKPYLVTFSGRFAGSDVPQLVCKAGTAPLSGGAGCSVATTREAVSSSLTRWNPDGTAANFPALGSNRIDGRDGADGTPSNAGIGTFFRNQIAVDTTGGLNDGNIYVADDTGDAIHIFSEEGTLLGQLTAVSGDGKCSGGQFTSAVGVAVDADGNVHFSGSVDINPEPGEVFSVRVIAKFAPSANPPVNADCVAKKEVSGLNIAAGIGPSDGFLFLSSASSGLIEKRDAVTETYGDEKYTLVGNALALVTVEPLTGNVFRTALSSKKVFEYDASGDEEAKEVSLLEDAKTNVEAITPAEGGELLYVGRASSEEVDVYEAVPIPEATTGPPENVSGAKATATGTVDPAGVEVTDCFFEYGPTATYELGTKKCTEPVIGEEGTDEIPVSAELTGMRANGRTYHYRLVVKGNIGGGQEGTDKGDDETLITKETYTAEPATEIDLEEATLNGIVKPEGVAPTGCFFEWGETTEYGQSAPCTPLVNGEVGDADIPVSAALTELDPSTTYHYRLVVTNGLGLGQIVSADRTFATLGAPGIEAQIASKLGEIDEDGFEDTATLQALVNPFGRETSYHFKWGPDNSYGNVTPVESAGSGSKPILVSAEISGLVSKSEYHFRLVATNSFDTTEGPDQAFETLNEHDLPDNRAFELISPVDKGPSGNLNFGFISQIGGPSADGNSFAWPLQNGMPDTTAGGWLAMKARRIVKDAVPKGWLSNQVSAPSLVPAPEIEGERFAVPSIVLYRSEDLSCGLLQTYNPLSSDVLPASRELGVQNLYLWHEGSGEVPFRPSDDEIAYRPAQANEIGYELVTERLPLNPELDKVGRHYGAIDAADDCSRVYFNSSYKWIANSSGLYEWEGVTGALRDAGLRPDGLIGGDLGTGANRAVLGGAVSFNASRENAVTPEGDLFFTALNAAERPAIFMRSGGGAVVEISGPEPGALAAATVGARFEAASPDGNMVFFRANHGLDADASGDEPTNVACGPRGTETDINPAPNLEQKACDLYAYDVDTGELVDLTVDANPEDPLGAALQGTVAVDGDGSHVYFAALGQLTSEEGRSYAQNIAGGGRANVYLAAAGGLTYVTNLRWQELLKGMLTRRYEILRAQASADGSHLLYAANSRQNWYEGGGGLVAYLYDAGRDQVRCVSCRPDGEPTSVNEKGEVSPADNTARVLSDRALSADGRRVFFSSTDVLMPGAEAGRPNVYEWEEGQIYFLAVADAGSQKPGLLPELRGYRGMSTDGASAFLASNHQLVPRDRDSISDVYAVRVDGGVPEEVQLPECQVNESIPLGPNQIYCQGARRPQPVASNLPSEGFFGPVGIPSDPCARPAKRAKRLAKRAKALREKQPELARRLARAASQSAKAAKRCRAKIRAANTSAGGAR